MIQDLIDLYYYIRSSDDIRDLRKHRYQDHNGIHVLQPNIQWNATYTDHNWEFKMTAGSTITYRQIFLSKNEVEVIHKGIYFYAIAVPSFITEKESDMLMKFISTDEITIMNQIYLEMRKLKNRSRPYERANP